MEPSDYLTLDQVAARLGKSKRTVRRWIKDGKLPAEKKPRGQNWIWLVSSSDLPGEGKPALSEANPDENSPQSGRESLHLEGDMTEVKDQPETEAFDSEEKPGPEEETHYPEDTRKAAEDVLAPIEARLARIEGALAGRWVSELSEKLAALVKINGELQQELRQVREESRRREEALMAQLAELQELEPGSRPSPAPGKASLTSRVEGLTEQLTALQQAAQRRAKAAQEREADLVSRMEAMREELRKREEQSQQELAHLRAEAQRREVDLVARLTQLQQTISQQGERRAWWKRLWPRRKPLPEEASGGPEE